MFFYVFVMCIGMGLSSLFVAEVIFAWAMMEKITEEKEDEKNQKGDSKCE